MYIALDHGLRLQDVVYLSGHRSNCLPPPLTMFRLISIEYYNLIGHSEVSKSLRHLLIYLDTCNWSLKLKLLWLD